MKKIAILQSNYIPWKGVFDMINMVDEFVFFEDVAFTKRDWRSRNKIPTPNGEIWLTVPVNKAERGTKIKDITINHETDWQRKHYLTLSGYYKKAPFYKEYEYLLDDIYKDHQWNSLSEMNIYITIKISTILGITTKFVNSADLNTCGTKDDKLIEICQKLNATHYLSGPAAKDYIVDDKFKKAKLGLSYIKYDGYPNYKQLYGEFNHYVSVLDVLMNCGQEAPLFIFMGNEEVVIE